MCINVTTLLRPVEAGAYAVAAELLEVHITVEREYIKRYATFVSKPSASENAASAAVGICSMGGLVGGASVSTGRPCASAWDGGECEGAW